jgi:hypothetical protein
MIARTAARRPLLLLLVGMVSALAHGFQDPKETALIAEMNDAVEQVKRIVNEPVPALARTPDARVSVFRPGWFHEGATRPNFLSVDVRATQQFPYDKFEYVTSEQNPGLMFRGRDLEFNGMTKYFYTDRSTPKKRLDPPEMAEINRLYRVIGSCEQELARLRGEPDPAGNGSPVRRPAVAVAPLAPPPAEPMPTGIYLAAGSLLVMLTILLYRLRRSRPAGRD